MSSDTHALTLAKSVELAVEQCRREGSVLRVASIADSLVRAHGCRPFARGLVVDALCAHAIRKGLIVEFDGPRNAE